MEINKLIKTLQNKIFVVNDIYLPVIYAIYREPEMSLVPKTLVNLAEEYFAILSFHIHKTKGELWFQVLILGKELCGWIFYMGVNDIECLEHHFAAEFKKEFVEITTFENKIYEPKRI
jgi:F0F1-type ATP synthase membrane subunit a